MTGAETPLTREPARFYPPRVRLLLLAAGCLVVVAISYLPTNAPFTLIAGMGWLGVGLFSLAALVLLARALRPGPTVEVDQRGITDRTTLAAAGLIRWEDINAIRKREIGRGMGAERLLEILLTDAAQRRHQPPSWLRGLIERYRRALKQPVVSIPGSMVAMPMQAVLDAVAQHRPELQVLQGPPPAPSKFRWGPKPERGRRHPDLPRW